MFADKVVSLGPVIMKKITGYMALNCVFISMEFSLEIVLSYLIMMLSERKRINRVQKGL